MAEMVTILHSRPQDGDIVVSSALVDAYAGLNAVGILLLLILVITILVAPKTRLHRDPTLINAFIVLILVNTVNIIYYIACGGNIGVWESLHRPHLRLCKVQAVILAGSQPAQAATVFALCFRLWLTTMELSVSWFHRLRGKVVLCALLALPYLCIIGFIPAMALSINKRNPELSPTPFYCATLDDELRSSYQNLALAFASLSLLIEIHLIWLVTRHFHHTSMAAVQASGSLHHTIGVETHLAPERSIKLLFFVRVGVFISWTLLMIAATLYQSFDRTTLDPYSDMIFACVAPMAFCCFATQPDVLRTWRIPTSFVEWRLLFTRKSRKSRRVSTTQAKLTGELAWAEFLGSTSPDTIYRLDSQLDQVEKGRHSVNVNVSELEVTTPTKASKFVPLPTLGRLSEAEDELGPRPLSVTFNRTAAHSVRPRAEVAREEEQEDEGVVLEK